MGLFRSEYSVDVLAKSPRAGARMGDVCSQAFHQMLSKHGQRVVQGSKDGRRQTLTSGVSVRRTWFFRAEGGSHGFIGTRFSGRRGAQAQLAEELARTYWLAVQERNRRGGLNAALR